MSKLAVICGGQGTQFPSMDQLWDFDEKNKVERFNLIQEKLNVDLKSILNSEQVNETVYAQPLIVWLQTLIYDEIKRLKIPIAATAGFSLGEYSSYYVAEMLSAKETIKLVLKRSGFMQEASSKKPGSMVAVLGLDYQKVEELVKEVHTEAEPLYPANYNTQIQTVVSGSNNAIETFMEIAKQKGARRVVKLNVSGAFHTPLMQEAAEKLEQHLKTLNLSKPQIPFYLNSTAAKMDYNIVSMEAKKQTMGPVYFQKMVEQMIKDGITHFVEIGPKAVLASMIAKINSEVNVIAVTESKNLNELKEWIKDVQFEK
ncbi:MAG: ACP S-malonyltransferase [Acholeplasmataceae bacterium]